MNRLEARNITYSYDNKVNVIENIQLSVGEGEIVCLLGVSGGGKTTLFNVISGLNRPQQGEILLDGEDITGVPGKISYMLQKDLLLPYRTIEANALRSTRISRNSDLRAPRRCIRLSSRAVCGKEPRC